VAKNGVKPNQLGIVYRADLPGGKKRAAPGTPALSSLKVSIVRPTLGSELVQAMPFFEQNLPRPEHRPCRY